MRYQAATNLFAGLSRYSLKPKKSALENFCTELLAWCLQNSRRFQGEFLKLIKLDLLKNFQGPIQIGTQQYWTYKGNDEEDEDNEGQAEPKAGMSGFFDLEIQSARQTNGKRDFLIAIESKIGADFELGQLEKYRAELKKRSINFSQSYLVTLTTHSTRPALADAHIKWSQVQELLSKAPLEDNLKNLEIIYLQFADFLKGKGMAPMKIDIPKHWQNRSRSLVLTRSLDPKATKLGYIFANRLTPNITVMRTRFTNGCCPQRKNFRSYSRGNAEFFV